MFRGLIYFTGFASVSASAAFALVLAHDTLSPSTNTVGPAVAARLAPVREAPVERATPAPVAPVPQVIAPAPQPAAIITTADTATPTSLRPRMRDTVVAVQPAAAAPKRVASKVESKDVFEGIERLNPSELRQDVPVMAFQSNEQTDGRGHASAPQGELPDNVFPSSASNLAAAPAPASLNPYVSRSIQAPEPQRLANNWNVGVYR